MKPMIVILSLLIPLACSDADPFRPDESPATLPDLLEVVETAEPAVKMVPFKAQGTWVYGAWGAYDCASSDGSTRIHHVTVDYDFVTHMGAVTAELYQCAHEASWYPFWANEVITAANGDQLFVFNPGVLPAEEIPEGFTWGMWWEAAGGTGRFEGVTGTGKVYGTFDFATLGGDFVVDAVISSVGSTKNQGG